VGVIFGLFTLLVDGEEGCAEGFGADAVAGALVGEGWSPAAGGGDGAGGCAASYVGSGSGEDEDAGLAGEGGVECDLDVADEEEVSGDAGGEGFVEPVGYERDGLAGGADAGAGDVAEGDAAEGGELREGVVEGAGGGVGVDAKALDGGGADSGELAGFVGEEVVGLCAACVDGEVEGHALLLLFVVQGTFNHMLGVGWLLVAVPCSMARPICNN